jgi:AcrR family transcriptional regulator
MRYRAEHPDEGLRERKRRLTRQLISDTATVMFASRGFDAVKVSEVADRVNVSLKRLYNYFPTKESMVLDDADELVERVATALRDRPAGTSITDVVVAALEANNDVFDLLEDDLAAHVATMFDALIKQTPALRAHWLEVLDRLANVAAEELALQAGIQPTDPQLTIAGRALVGLVQVDMDSRVRHIRAGQRGARLGAISSSITDFPTPRGPTMISAFGARRSTAIVAIAASTSTSSCSSSRPANTTGREPYPGR